jgi:putative ABC transport system permease protein
VNDFRPWNVGNDGIPPLALVPYPYQPSPFTGLTIRDRGTAPGSITPAVREAGRASDALLPLYNVRTGEENRALGYWEERIIGGMFAIFGGVALLLAWVGIYGVLSYSVVQRTQEIGIRMAIGAGRRDVFRLVLGHGARLAGIGIVLGVAGAAAVTRIVQNQLYNVGPMDPLSFGGMALVLAAAVLLASYVPARRATAVDPLVALRTE